MRGFGIVNKENYLLGQATGKKVVLHVGCASSPSTRKRLAQGDLLHSNLARAKAPGATLTGIDIDPDGVEILREHLPDHEIVVGDACLLRDHFGDRRFDFIIAGDVIEHIANPGHFVAACVGQLSPNGVVVFTTINAFGIARFLQALLNHEAVHPDHVAYYSTKTLATLLRRDQLTILESGYYRAEPLSGVISINRAVSNAIEYAATAIWPQFGEGIVVTARRPAA
jgi:2-polyprenyl-3-methyl-5-hydroxy-6-metoxy-1,4-benzoquinol methylase